MGAYVRRRIIELLLVVPYRAMYIPIPSKMPLWQVLSLPQGKQLHLVITALPDSQIQEGTGYIDRYASSLLNTSLVIAQNFSIRGLGIL